MISGLIANVEEYMTEFLGADGGQTAYEVTGVTAVAEEVCIGAAWLEEPGRANMSATLRAMKAVAEFSYAAAVSPGLS